MKIELTQVEIEQAIEDYVRERVQLVEGSTLSIGMIASRGEEGFKASIEILAEGHQPTAVVAAEPVIEEKAPAKKTGGKLQLGGKKAETKPEPELEPEPEAIVEEVAQQAAAKVLAEVVKEEVLEQKAQETVTEEPAPEPVQEDAPEVEEPEPEVKAAPRKLFAGLKRPVNS